MKRLVYICMLLIATATSAIADKYDAGWWKKANGFYNSRQYDSALTYFEKIAALSPRNEEVYYNLGNTYYRLNLIGSAVLNYERALHLRPGYKQAKDNLLLTQSRIPNRIPGIEEIFFVRWWHGLTSGHYATTWAVISILLFAILMVLLIAKRLRKGGRMPAQAIPFVSVVWLFALFISVVAAGNRQNHNAAVVMQQDAPLHAQPNDSKVQSMVPEGTTVKYEDVAGDWIEVTLPDGRRGFMQKVNIEKI